MRTSFVSSRPRRSPLAAAAALVFLLASCSPPAGNFSASGVPASSAETNQPACEELASDPPWHGENRRRLVAMIDELGDCGGDKDAAQGAPLAVFDWDNTVVKNDIGDATTYWMLANGKVLQPADWAGVSTFMTTDAIAALAATCGSLTEPGHPLPTDTPAGVADEILAVYGRRQHHRRSGGVRRLQRPPYRTSIRLRRSAIGRVHRGGGCRVRHARPAAEPRCGRRNS